MRSEAGYKREKKLNLSGLPTIIFTFLICAACWIIGYYGLTDSPVRSGSGASSLLWDVVCRILPMEIHKHYLIGFFLLCLGAAFLQRFNFLFIIIKEKTTLPFLLFLLLNSVNPDFYPFQPVSLAMFLLLFALFELYGSFQKSNAIGRIFNMMVYLSIGSLLWPYLLLFTPVFWFGMYRFRILSFRTFMASLLGVFTVGWFVLGWCAWKHDWGVFINFAQCIADIRFVFTQESRLLEWLTPFWVLFFMIVVSIHISLLKHENTSRTHHFIFFLLIFGVFSFIVSMFYAPNSANFQCIFYIPASIIVSSAFSGKYGIATFLLFYLFMLLLIVLFFVRIWNFL